MLIRALQPIASPYGTAAAGEGLEVPDEIAAIWIEAGAVEILTAEPEPVVDIAAELAALRARMAELEEARAAQAQTAAHGRPEHEPEAPATAESDASTMANSDASLESPPDPDATAPAAEPSKAKTTK